ncbi:hypothetical protein [Cellulomonas sp. B6]|uniref:DUF6912 family protein n=1 Tax=Cellulomonas sp. B6 TaxID=1295626 RepID=UPI00073D05EE|nr:hypothetical protein [Cellulomonas sp. B6]KSW13752.1 hypothetical protein ATM99_03400 [Cellulomonas sp. B6]KSW14630.1 hypothetical protein ATM99_02610 [Cellulomonas sp. B6]
MRVYLPVTLDELQHGSPVLLTPRVVHAVTPLLRATWPEEDEEGWEYAAQAGAADDSLVRVAGRPEAPPLRVVVAADVPEAAVRPLADAAVPSAVQLVSDVDLAAVVSVHVDEPEAAPDVRAVVEGDESAIERLEERDLLWYDVSEVADIPSV